MLRRTMFWVMIIGVLAAIFQADWTPEESTAAAAEATAPERPWEVIDVAIALDTSGSMEYLIEAARLKLWAIVHDLTLLEPTPTLRVALLTFGNFKNHRDAGWVRVETDLTEDLDQVSERLFMLTAEGGTEYLGRVLKVALQGLSWTPSEYTLKLVFVVGNEPANQDPEVSFREMAERARDKGILVNAVFCGSGEHEDAASWKEMAELADGQFATIDHRRRTVIVKTPFDEEIAELSAEINDTYIPLGERGRQRRRKLAEQDKNAKMLSPEAATSRAQVKTTRLYCAGWDLVDALDAGRVSLYDLEKEELPENLRAMSIRELEIYVEEMRKRRAELREQIAEMAEMRRQRVSAQINLNDLGDSMTFDAALRRVILKRAEEKGFRLPER